MTWKEAQDLLATTPSVSLLPVGATEQHGHHLPLGTDTIMVEEVCRRVAAKSEATIVAPAIPYGTSHNHASFAGTLSLSLDGLKRILVEVGSELVRHGSDIVIIVNGHGGNVQAVAAAAYELRQLQPAAVIAQVMWPSVVHEAWKVLEGDIAWHADESETSLMLHLDPELVQMDKAVDDPPHPLPFFTFTEESLAATKLDLGLPRTDALSSTGTIGYATMATPSKGEAIVAEAVDKLSLTVRDLRLAWPELSQALSRLARN
jgi:creatinine amidohydrolase